MPVAVAALIRLAAFRKLRREISMSAGVASGLRVRGGLDRRREQGSWGLPRGFRGCVMGNLSICRHRETQCPGGPGTLVG